MNVTRSLSYLALGICFLFTYVCKKRATSTPKKSDKRYETKTEIENQVYEPSSAESTIEKTNGPVHHRDSNITYEKLKESSVEKHESGPETKTIATSDEKDLQGNTKKHQFDSDRPVIQNH